MRGRRTRSGRRSETCSARRPLARFRVTRRARWVAWVGLGVVALRCGGDSAQRAICAPARFMQLRRPATLLPSSRRAPRGCPETMLGCSGREMRPSLPASSWPGQASVLSLYSVTPVTARAKTYQFVSCQELKRCNTEDDSEVGQRRRRQSAAREYGGGRDDSTGRGPDPLPQRHGAGEAEHRPAVQAGFPS